MHIYLHHAMGFLMFDLPLSLIRHFSESWMGGDTKLSVYDIEWTCVW